MSCPHAHLIPLDEHRHGWRLHACISCTATFWKSVCGTRIVARRKV